MLGSYDGPRPCPYPGYCHIGKGERLSQRERWRKTMTANDMIMFSNGALTFMYRVGAIAVHNERLLVEHDAKLGLCFIPGGRVEYGENAMQALAREVQEELGEEATIGRLALVTDNLFELDQRPYQEIALYFLIEFAPGSPVLDRDGPFEGNELGTVFQWIPLEAVEQANLFPTFLQSRVKAIPPTTEYIVHPNALH